MTAAIDPGALGHRHAAFVYICTCGHHLTVFASTAPSARHSDTLAQRRGWKLEADLWTCPDCADTLEKHP